jgi:hypothetical protein
MPSLSLCSGNHNTPPHNPRPQRDILPRPQCAGLATSSPFSLPLVMMRNVRKKCVAYIWVSHNNVTEDWNLLRCYTLSTGEYGLRAFRITTVTPSASRICLSQSLSSYMPLHFLFTYFKQQIIHKIMVKAEIHKRSSPNSNFLTRAAILFCKCL